MMGGVLCSHRSHGTGWCYIYVRFACLKATHAWRTPKHCGELTAIYGNLGTAWATSLPKSEKQLKQRKPDLCGFFVGLSRSSRETFSTFETDMSDGSGSSRMDSWDLNTSIPSTVITELLPRWSRIELTSWQTPDPRPMMDAFVSWASGLVGLGSKDENPTTSFVGIKMIKISHYI